MVICLETRADLHVTQLMPLPLTVSCFSKIQIGFTFLVPAVKRNGCECVCYIAQNKLRCAKQGEKTSKFLSVWQT